jgi:hypothetical protein
MPTCPSVRRLFSLLRSVVRHDNHVRLHRRVASIISDQLHRPAYEVGVYLAVLIGGVWIGSAAASRLVGRAADQEAARRRQPPQHPGRVRVSGRRSLRPSEPRSEHRADVRLHDRRRDRLADGVERGGEHQPPCHRLGLGALWLHADGGRRALDRARRHRRQSGAVDGVGSGRRRHRRPNFVLDRARAARRASLGRGKLDISLLYHILNKIR